MVKIRIRFKRTEELRFLSHLDQQRLFMRALRRAQLPFAFTQGFNPHPIISFANAMSVGMTSDCEYVDIGVAVDDDKAYSPQIFMRKLAEEMPQGIELVDAALIPREAKSLSGLIQSADYDIRCLNIIVNNFEDFQESLNQFNDLKNIIIQKEISDKRRARKRGSSTIETDIREYFDTISVEKDNDDVIFHIKMLPVSGSLLSPKKVVQTFLRSIDYYENSLTLITHRRTLNLKGGGVTPIKN